MSGDAAGKSACATPACRASHYNNPPSTAITWPVI
jgi:hypothetical protein